MNLDLRSRRTTSTTISLHEHEAPSLENSTNQRVCLVCSTKEASYCCPRCFKPYCSVQCYKNHDILCTEEFDREKVEAVLAREQDEQEQARQRAEKGQGRMWPRGDSGSPTGRAVVVSPSDLKKVEEGEDSVSDEEEDEDGQGVGEHIDDEVVQHLAAKLSLVGGKSPTEVASSLTSTEQRVLKQITHSTVARKFLKSAASQKRYWETGGINIEERHHLRVEVRQAMQAVAGDGLEMCRSGGDDGPDPLCFQLVGLLLGYVVMMRTLNGTWVSIDDELPLAGQGTNGGVEGDSSLASCWEALGLCLQSTPFVDPNFRPTSVDTTIQAWVYCQPPSLQQPSSGGHHQSPTFSQTQSRQVTQAVLCDVLQLLDSAELTMFALLDCWLLGLLCCATPPSPSAPRPALPLEACLRLACRPPTLTVAYAEDMVTLLQAYAPYFSTHAPLRKGKHRRQPAVVCDKFTRKCFFLIQHFSRATLRDEAMTDTYQKSGLVQCVENVDPSDDVAPCWTDSLQQLLQAYHDDVLHS